MTRESSQYNSDWRELKKLSIVVPTYNRNYYLSRCLFYHSQFPYGKIIVADSSFKEKKQINKSTIEKIKSLAKTEITYLEYDPETEPLGGDVYQKWADAINHVDTKYSQIVTDKEFANPQGQIECIEFLENNPNIHLCEGKFTYIESIKHGKYSFRNMYPSKVPLMDDNVLTRLHKAKTCVNVSSNQMGIKRTAFFQSLYHHLQKYRIDDLRFGEITLEILTIIRTKTMYLPVSYGYRDICNYSSGKKLLSKESSALRYPNLLGYKNMGIYDDYFERFVNCLKPDLFKYCPNIDEKMVESVIQNDVLGIIKVRKFFRSLVKQHPLWYLWNYSPCWVKVFGSKLIPKKYLDVRLQMTPNETKMMEIIENTHMNNMTDNPIHIDDIV